MPTRQLSMHKPSKREATKRWRLIREIVSALEVTEVEQAAQLAATRAALKQKRAEKIEAENELAESLDVEEPLLPGAAPVEPTLPE